MHPAQAGPSKQPANRSDTESETDYEDDDDPQPETNQDRRQLLHASIPDDELEKLRSTHESLGAIFCSPKNTSLSQAKASTSTQKTDGQPSKRIVDLTLDDDENTPPAGPSRPASFQSRISSTSKPTKSKPVDLKSSSLSSDRTLGTSNPSRSEHTSQLEPESESIPEVWSCQVCTL